MTFLTRHFLKSASESSPCRLHFQRRLAHPSTTFGSRDSWEGQNPPPRGGGTEIAQAVPALRSGGAFTRKKVQCFTYMYECGLSLSYGRYFVPFTRSVSWTTTPVRTWVSGGRRSNWTWDAASPSTQVRQRPLLLLPRSDRDYFSFYPGQTGTASHSTQVRQGLLLLLLKSDRDCFSFYYGQTKTASRAYFKDFFHCGGKPNNHVPLQNGT